MVFKMIYSSIHRRGLTLIQVLTKLQKKTSHKGPNKLLNTK